MWKRDTITICLCVFATTSSIAWAVAITNIYTPSRPARTALQECAAAFNEHRNSPFCMEVAKRDVQ